jgi:starch phosphorylase
MGNLLPRHLEIIYAINWHFLDQVKAMFGDDNERLRRMSLIDESHGKAVRMANLAIVGSHAVNGVAAIHTELVKSVVFPDFFTMFPERFQNKTNGVTPRRWINQANPGLSAIVTKWLDGEDWLKDLDLLTGLRSVADHPGLHKEWQMVKAANKGRLADVIKKTTGVTVNPAALFDVQVKRIHEYKRQQLNALYCIHRYRWIKSLSPAERASRVVPRVTIFGGKAAPGYDMAKRIIRLIHRIVSSAPRCHCFVCLGPSGPLRGH